MILVDSDTMYAIVMLRDSLYHGLRFSILKLTDTMNITPQIEFPPLLSTQNHIAVLYPYSDIITRNRVIILVF